MKIYLAARFSRIAEMAQHKTTLENLGHIVTSRWVTGVHDEATEADCAKDDIEDILAADTVISFTEPPNSIHARGGRHVEFGIALATNKRLIVVGYRENIFHHLPNVFHHLPQVEFCKKWVDVLIIL